MDDFNDDTKVGYRRIEILTGPSWRRRWTDEDKSRIAAEAMMPCAVVSQIARRLRILTEASRGFRFDVGHRSDLSLAAEVLMRDLAHVPPPSSRDRRMVPLARKRRPPRSEGTRSGGQARVSVQPETPSEFGPDAIEAECLV